MKAALLIAILVSVFCSFVIGAKDTRYMISIQSNANMPANELPPSRI